MKKQKIITIDTIACLKHKYCDVEWHLKSSCFCRGPSPLNIFQILLYWILGFDYIYGPKYIEYMNEKFKKEK